MYIFQLNKLEKFQAYKRIKQALIKSDLFNYEDLVNALNSKLDDLVELFNDE